MASNLVMVLPPMASSRSMPLSLGWMDRVVHAGPYDLRADGTWMVKLAPEVPGEADRYLPIRDYSIPDNKQAVDDVVWETLNMLACNQPVYIGCRGGLGRTGLFLALLAKVTGVPDPVAYVRLHYNVQAVETPLQKKYVSGYRLPISPWTYNGLLVKAAMHGFTPRRLTIP